MRKEKKELVELEDTNGKTGRIIAKESSHCYWRMFEHARRVLISIFSNETKLHQKSHPCITRLLHLNGSTNLDLKT